MEVRRPGEWQRPRPEPSDFERPFYEAAAAGELRYQHCPACGHAQFYPRPLCTACGADPEWRSASGRGSVHTFTVVRQNLSPGFRDDVPYVVAMVELEEGVRMLGNVIDCAVEDVRIGLPVEAVALEFEPGLALPVWVPRG
jgi:uncharacterized OB-fold protein